MFIQLLEEGANWLFSPICVGVGRNIPLRRCVEGNGSMGDHEITIGVVVEFVASLPGK